MANYTEKGYDPSTHGYWKGTIDGQKNFGWPKNYYYADTIRSVFIAFGNYFNDFKIVRRNQYGEPEKVIIIPIKYGPREKSHDFRTEEESGDKYYISLPNITYKLSGLQFAENRATGLYEQRAFYNDPLSEAGIEGDLQEQFWSDIQPVPYDLTIDMEINLEKMDDATQFFEQFAVRFKPAAFLNIKEFWFFNKRRSVKMKLNSPGLQIDNDAMGEEDRRTIKLTASFTVECFLYNPIKSAPIIERIDTYLSSERTDMVWHQSLFGNKNGSLDKDYDFSKIYNTRVCNALVLKEGYPKTEFDKDSASYITTYEYENSENLTTYDSKSKLLSKVVTRWIPQEHREFIPSKVYDKTIDKIVYSAIQFPPTIGDPILVPNQDMQYYQLTDKKYNDLPVVKLCNVYEWNGNTYSGKPIMELDEEKSKETGIPSYKTISYGPMDGDWYTEKEYILPASGYDSNNDSTIEFDFKTLYDRDGNAYSAYYSHYSEEGIYSVSAEPYLEGKVDYQFSAHENELIFSGSKFDVKKSL